MSFPLPTTWRVAREMVLNVINAAQKHTQSGGVDGMFPFLYMFKQTGNDE